MNHEHLWKFRKNPVMFNYLMKDVIIKELRNHFNNSKINVIESNVNSPHIKSICVKHFSNLLRNFFSVDFKQVKDGTDVFYNYTDFKNGIIYGKSTSTAYCCDSCGSFLTFIITHDTIKIEHDNECFNVKDYVLDFVVPDDGIMAINDSLGDILKKPDEFISVNNEKGKYEHSKYAESQGFIHFYVGNSCPSVYQLDEDTIVVSRSSVFENEGCELNTEEYPEIKKIASVCTDLWWVTMAPKEHCKAIESTGKRFRQGEEMKLKPGKWTCTVHTPDDYTYEFSTAIYATFKRVK